MNSGNGILMLAIGLVGGLVLGGAMKQCPTATTAPAPARGYWDVLISALPIAKDIYDSWGRDTSAGVHWA